MRSCEWNDLVSCSRTQHNDLVRSQMGPLGLESITLNVSSLFLSPSWLYRVSICFFIMKFQLPHCQSLLTSSIVFNCLPVLFESDFVAWFDFIEFPRKVLENDGKKLARHIRNRGRPTEQTWQKYKESRRQREKLAGMVLNTVSDIKMERGEFDQPNP